MARRQPAIRVKKGKKPLTALPDEYKSLRHFLCRFCWEDKKAIIIDVGRDNVEGFFSGRYLFLCPECSRCRSCHFENDDTGDIEIAWLHLSEQNQGTIERGVIPLVREPTKDDGDALRRGRGHFF